MLKNKKLEFLIQTVLLTLDRTVRTSFKHLKFWNRNPDSAKTKTKPLYNRYTFANKDSERYCAMCYKGPPDWCNSGCRVFHEGWGTESDIG